MTNPIKWFTEQIQQQIREHAATSPAEVCGLILDDGTALQSPNVHPTPTLAFAIDPTIWIANKAKAIAIYHSHPSDDNERCLSFADCRAAIKDNIPIILFHPDAGFDLYDPNHPNPYPLQDRGDPKTVEHYLDWRWHWGRVDCGRLVYHYYLGMLGIKLKPVDVGRHEGEPGLPGWNKLAKSLAENGFVQVDDIRQHDIILMHLECENDHHAAVVVDGVNQILLHIENEDALSRLEKYHLDYQHKTGSVWRHEKFL